MGDLTSLRTATPPLGEALGSLISTTKNLRKTEALVKGSAMIVSAN